MRDEEGHDIEPVAVSWFTRILTDLPTVETVWEEAALTNAEDHYAAKRFQGLYEQCKNLLETLAARQDRAVSTSQTVVK